ncbi:aldo/keto reductase [Psychroflexus aestuariivivens]|uniref:aldo/keto reductase n=1 Tax=Psychroflexus aestuariivivens TaxID=1795040 RepID=UPI000FD9DE04|nr:aldo/keto reductase [Psychroflexus aestuariivivens]
MSTLINKIGVGTVQFGIDYGISNNEGKTPLSEVKKILEYSLNIGIEYIDTAFAYGNAEEVLGNFDLSDFKIISKYIPKPEFNLNSQFKESLNRLKLSSIYGYMAHRPLDLLEDKCKAWQQLQELKNEGLVKKIGASFNTIKEFEKLKSHKIELDIIQVPYNYFDRRFELIMRKLKDNGCEIHTRSTFLQGLFFYPTDSLHPFFQDIKEDLKILQSYDNLANRLLAHSLNIDFIDVVNIGVNNLNQLKENTKELDQNLFDLPVMNKQINNNILTPSSWPQN